MNYEEQINRIKTKLVSAREADKAFQVFGSRSHKSDNNMDVKKMR